MPEKYGVIYKITNLINGKIYIGQTKRTFKERYSGGGEGIERVYRYHTYRKNYGELHNDHLLKSINKYGFDNFVVDEEFDVAYSQEELNQKEKYWIQHYNCNNPYKGYNATEGGDSGKRSSYRKYIRNFRTQRIKPFIVIESGEVFISKREFINNCKMNLDLIDKNTLSSEYRNKIYEYKHEYEYQPTSKYNIYYIKCPQYNENCICKINKNTIPVINIKTKEIFMNNSIVKKKYGKHILTLCDENMKNQDINSDWMYLVEFLAHEKCGDFEI